MSQIPKVKLSNGVEMPIQGFGVFQIPDHKECEQAVLDALECGYRAIDTASAYCNEEAVGRAIKKSGIPREQLFITTKVFVHEFGYEKTKEAFERSIKKLQTTYLDLYLIHQPYHDFYDAWKALEELYKGGKIKAIGVSNFVPELLEKFCNDPRIHIKPMVNQIEYHPFKQREKDIEVSKKLGVAVESWGTLYEARKEIWENQSLKDIAKKHNKTIAQVSLRWAIQNGIIIIPKSVHKERMIENLKIYDFKLDEDDIKKIKELNGKALEIFDHNNPEGEKIIDGFAKIVQEYQQKNPV